MMRLYSIFEVYMMHEMVDSSTIDNLERFLSTGIYRFEESNDVFMDPVRILSRFYDRFTVSPSSYYSRHFKSNIIENFVRIESSKKRKQEKKHRNYVLNIKERVADHRHKKARPVLVRAHESLLMATELLHVIRDIREDKCFPTECDQLISPGSTCSFVELGKIWQAPLYEITLNSQIEYDIYQDGDFWRDGEEKTSQKVLPVFENLVSNDTCNDVVAEFLNKQYIIPRDSSFYMSDINKLFNLIPGTSDDGFDLLVIDPPWENKCAQQKSMYPTLPNRYFMSLPIKELSHKEGSLVALWVTHREKLLSFVENELFPLWGVHYLSTFYWLKINTDGSLVSDLELFHRRPYECLVLGFCNPKDEEDDRIRTIFKCMKDDRVVMSVPGAHSRKPPIGELILSDCYYGVEKPVRCLELFARDMMSGWTSWGNEPFLFQESTYLPRKR